MASRREFLKVSGGGALVSFAPALPGILGNAAVAAEADADEKVLVVIQLEGGNDGINTVVPFGDDGYAKARQKLRQDANGLHKLNDHVGLHRSMKAAFELFEDDRLAIAQGVGYPNPNRSHFSSMKIWQTASLDSEDHAGNGWLGRALDQRFAATQSSTAPSSASAIFVGGQETPPALWGRRSIALSLSKADDLQLERETQQMAYGRGANRHTALEQFVHQQAATARTAAKDFADKNARVASNASYPNTRLANQLKFVSTLLRSGNPARVYYTVQPGYDTHADQESQHANLLQEFSGAVKSFLDDLQAAGLDDRVVVLAFSEFGRRVAENDSAGTDHGSSGPVFLAGRPIRGGLIGKTPDMSNLVDGDLKTTIDFRRIYTTLLNEWLQVSPEAILRDEFEPLELFS